MDVRTRLPRAKSGATGNSDDLINSRLLASKLFSYAICHGDDCRLPIGTTAKRLQKFTGDKSYDTKKTLEFVKSSRDKFLIKNVDGKQFVEAKTSVKICDSFQEGMCKSAGCKELHICRFFLEGTVPLVSCIYSLSEYRSKHSLFTFESYATPFNPPPPPNSLGRPFRKGCTKAMSGRLWLLASFDLCDFSQG